MTNDITWLQDRLRGEGKPVVIDGGMGTHLQDAGVPMDGEVWSGRAVLSHPHAVRQAHEAFIIAGAEVIITNTFSAARHMLAPAGLGDHVNEINRKAVTLAKEARDEVAEAPVAIAGSICEWTSTDDSEWHSPEAVALSAREQAELLTEAGVDLIALEMCERVEFSVAVTEAAMQCGLPVWIGVSAKKHRGLDSLSTCSYGDVSFEPLVKRLADFPAMLMNVMHTPVTDVDDALRMVNNYWDGPIGVYPESGYFTMPNWNFVDIIEPNELAQAARTWIDSGVRLVGGCCGLGPGHIAALRESLN